MKEQFDYQGKTRKQVEDSQRIVIYTLITAGGLAVCVLIVEFVKFVITLI